MALLMLITLGAFSQAGQGKYALGQRGTKVQLVQLCQKAHANKDQILASDALDDLIPIFRRGLRAIPKDRSEGSTLRTCGQVRVAIHRPPLAV